MRKVVLSATIIVAFVLSGVMPTSAQTVIFEERFDDASQFTVTTGALETDGAATNSDYLTVTDGSDIDRSYDGITGSYFAAQDIDGTPNGVSPSVIEWTGIDINGVSDPVFSGLFGEVFDSPGDIDNSDFVKFEYQIDGGGYQNLIAFENDGTGFNTNFFEDTDFDGVGDGTEITSSAGTMVFFEKSLVTGSTLDLRLTVALDSGDEDIAIEDIVISDGSIPVELATFTAQVSGTQAQLQWETLSETNNAGFDIQHKAPQSSSFSSLGFVEGHGTTDTPQSYRFNTDALDAGTHTFRLRQIDLDGTDEIHEPVTVEVRQSDLMRLTGPNPVQAGTATELTIQPEQSDDVTVALYNVLGQRVQTLHSGRVSADDVLRLTLDTSNLSSGMYFVRADGNSVRQTKRITVVR